MKNIRTIINEEISKYIITENIQSLMQLGNQLNVLLKQVCKIPTDNLNQGANKILYDTEYFVVQIVQAINRCVRANNLNESLGDWGINIPPELGGNFWYDAKRGYYNTKNYLTKANNGYNAQNAQNAAKGNYGKVNTTTVRSEKLSTLLQRSTQVYQNYQVGESKYQIQQYAPQISQGMRNIFVKIEEINKQYNALVAQQQNAQGQNP